VARHPFAAVNLISDPIHGYVELTKRLSREESTAAGLPDEEVAEDDLLDTSWLQRLRRISQLQSARWVFPTAEHSRFTHGLGVMHLAGQWARTLQPSLRSALPGLAPGEAIPSEGLVVETLRVAGLLHDVGHGPFAHFFDERVLAAFPAPEDARRGAGKRLSHEDLSQLIIEQELGPLIRGLRRAPGDGRVSAAVADGWRGILLRRPGWRADAELRATYEDGGFPAAEVATLDKPEDPAAVVDLAIVDSRPAADGTLAIEARDGGSIALRDALSRIPGYALIARRYRPS
jgi:hypothetical protein